MNPFPQQFQRLQYLLREERRRYCLTARKEREEQLMSIHAQPKDSPEEVAAYEVRNIREPPYRVAPFKT